MANPRAAELARLVLPAAVVGVASALVLAGVDVVAEALEDVLWDRLPSGLGVDDAGGVWIFAVLTAIGLAVGLVVWLAPGHAGPDPATEELIGPPLRPLVAPGLAVAAILALAGGVSLGPEGPVVAINISLAVWLGGRFHPKLLPPTWVGFAAAGTIGALFGTPVGAALMLTEMDAGRDDRNVWDRLFGPLVAAACGSLMMDALQRPQFAVGVPAYDGPSWPDVISGPLIAAAAALVGTAAVYAFPLLHRLFHHLRNPVVMLTAGGAVLGVLGAIGGTVTLFKGLSQMGELAADDKGVGGLVLVVVVKLTALVVAATCGFRGGRIFPSVFIGFALGLLAVQLFPDVPPTVAVSAALVGFLVVMTRSGWLSLLLAATVVGQIDVLPILCIAVLPAWLIATDRPPLLVKPRTDVHETVTGSA